MSEKHPTESFAIKGFHMPFRKDRTENKGGGILVYAKENINCKRRNDLESNELEHIWLEVQQPHSKSILLCILYRSPDSKSGWKESFENNLEAVQVEDKEILILGDFNRDLNNCRLNEEWINFMSSFGLKQLINTTTRECNITHTLIDHIYSDNPQNIIWTSVPKLGLSDHYPIFCSRKINPKLTKSNHHTIKYRSLKNFNENDFLRDLSEIDWNPVLQQTNVNESLKCFSEKMNSIIDRHVPIRQHRVKKMHQPDWLNSEIIDAMKSRDKFKIRGDIVNYKLYRNKVTALIYDAKRSAYEKKINDGQNDPSSIWKLFKEFRNPNGDKSTIHKLNIDGKEVTDSKRMSDEFNTFFTNIAANLKEQIPPSDLSNVNNFVNCHVPKPMYFNIPFIGQEKVKQMLLKLDVSKSTGLDNIGPKFLKLSANIIYHVVHHILYLSISQSEFPDAWKSAQVKPLFKSGAKSDLNNYRPISILPILSKILEKHVHDSFNAYLNHYKLILKSQSGFRKQHSCETALVCIIDKWLKALNDGFIVGVVMVDFRKAFDLVDHKVLLEKLKSYKCSDSTIRWFASYLNDRRQKVALNGETSSFQNVTCGVPQGSILGPLLFLLFINDLPISLRNVVSSTDMYADDTTIYDIQNSKHAVEHNLQSSMFLLEQWCKQNGMVLNTDKTKVLLITTPHKRARLKNDPLSVSFKSVPLKYSKGEKLLGVNINENLNWGDHVNKIKKKVSTNIWLLSRIKSFIPVNARILFYKAYIQPHFDFCNVIWGGTNAKNLNKLYVLQKRACKLIFGHSYLNVSSALEKMNCTSIYERILLQKARFMYKVSTEAVPGYISELFENENKVKTNLRYSCFQNYNTPRPKLELYRESMSYSGPSIWNRIPESIRCSNTIESFTSNFLRWQASNRK